MVLRGSLSLSRPLLAAARSALRSPAPLPRAARPIPVSAPRPIGGRRLLASPPRIMEELGCTMSMLPLHSVVAAARLRSHLSVSARAWCELTQGS